MTTCPTLFSPGSRLLPLLAIWLGWNPSAFAGSPPDPDPERFAAEIAAFEPVDGETPPAGAVVAVGSSSIRMWHSRINEDLAPLTLIPRGFGGSHFSDLNHYFDVLVGQYAPRAILVYEGDNDIASGKSRMRVFKDFLAFVNRTRSLEPAPRIYVISVKPSIARTDAWPRMRALNRLLEEYCDATDGLVFVDISEALMTAEGEMNAELFVPDMIHLNQRGYDRWSEAIRAVVVPAERAFEVSQ